jgi:tetratricopeptide (TPR) repeat protein
MNDEQNIAFTYYILANVYRDFGDYKRALTDARKGLNIYESLGTTEIIGNAIIGSIYDLANQIDSASFYIKKAFQMDRQINQGKWGWLYYLQGNIHRKMKQYDSAMYYYKAALPLVQYKDIVETFNGIATLYQETGREDSSIFYRVKSICRHQQKVFINY